jgi:MFS family permease
MLFERHLPWIFFCNSLALGCALVILLRMVPRSGGGNAGWPVPADRQGGSIRAFLGRPALLAYSVISVFVSLAYAQTGFGLTLYTSEAFGVRGAQVFGFLMSFNAVVVIASTTILTRITRRFSGPLVMGFGTTLYTVGFAMLAFRLDLKLLAVSTLVWSIGEVLLAINTGAYIADHTPADLRGRFQSICEAMASAGRILSPALFGVVIAGHGVHMSWLVTALVTLGCTAAFGLLHSWEFIDPDPVQA